MDQYDIHRLKSYSKPVPQGTGETRRGETRRRELGEAAQATGFNRSTIPRCHQGGRISGARDEAAHGSEPVELHRVFPPASAKPEPVDQDAQTHARWSPSFAPSCRDGLAA
jgi:hypothetical protein